MNTRTGTYIHAHLNNANILHESKKERRQTTNKHCLSTYRLSAYLLNT